MRKLRVFETFAGIGAQHKALSNLKKSIGFNFEVSGISEWDISANIAYAAIHHNKELKKMISKIKWDDNKEKELLEQTWSWNGKSPISNRKINNLSIETLANLWCSKKVNNSIGSILDITGQQILDTIGEVDILTYSFPCQDLSMAGSIHGFNKGMSEGLKTRSGLLWEIKRILNDLNKLDKKPKYLILENVKNMLSDRHIDQYNQWKKFLSSIGYSTKTFKLDSSKYGIPQTRKRVYGLSILDYKGKVKDGEIDGIKIPEEKKLKKLKNFLRTNYANPLYLSESFEAQPNRTPSRKKMFKENPILNSDSRQTIRTITTKQDRHPNAGIINLDNTILGNGNREKIGLEYKKANYRFITPREGYLLMGFNESDFDKVKSMNIKKEKLYQQVGNSIVVKTIEEIFKIIKDQEEK